MVSFWVHFGSILGFVLRSVLGSFSGPFWDQLGPRRSQDGPKRAMKSFKHQKVSFSKSVILQCENHAFHVLETPKMSIRGSGRLPRGTWRASRPQKKGFKNGTKKGEFSDHLWGSFGTPSWPQTWLEMGPRRDPKRIHIHITCILKLT